MRAKVLNYNITCHLKIVVEAQNIYKELSNFVKVKQNFSTANL